MAPTDRTTDVGWSRTSIWLKDFIEWLGKSDLGISETPKVSSYTTLPEGFEIADEVDTWPYAETDPEEKAVVASADTQTDGTTVAFYTYDLNGRRKIESADTLP